MKKSELIQAIKEALLPEIEKIVKKRVTLAAAQIIKENRKSAKPSVEKHTSSLSSLMNEQPTSNPYEVQGKKQGYKKQEFTSNGMLNDILNETIEPAIGEYISLTDLTDSTEQNDSISATSLPSRSGSISTHTTSVKAF